MSAPAYLARLRGVQDASIILPAGLGADAVKAQAADLLSQVTGRRVASADVELSPFFPKESDTIRI